MTLRVGVIGTGAIGEDHARRLTRRLNGVRIAALQDLDAARARRVAAKLDLDAPVYDDGEALIAAGDVDAVLVASSGPSHAGFVLAAIAADKPIFCEKPLATTARACRDIVAAEQRHGRRLVQVGFMRRYDPAYRALQRTLDEDRLGAVLLAHCVHRNVSVPDGFRGDMPLTDSFVHEIDAMRWLLADEFVSAQIVLPRKTRHASTDLQDPLIVLLETQKGVRVDSEIFVNCQYGYEVRCEIVAEQGTASLPATSAPTLRHDGRLAQEIAMDWQSRFADAYDIELQDWIDACRAGRATGPSAWDGYMAALTADACVAAKQAGRIMPVTVEVQPDFYASAS